MKPAFLLFCSFLLSLPLASRAQSDTVRIATYNLLNWGNSANLHATKKAWLQPILQAMQPAILGVNEVSTALPGACDSLLTLMPFPAARGAAYNTTGTTQLNTLFWDTTRFDIQRDTSVCNSVRDITAYQLRYKAPAGYDTIRLTVFVAHLKSSNTSADKADRATETACLADYLSFLNDTANYILLGDLNLYTSDEAAYQNLTAPANPLARLNDPINTPGDWNSDTAFAHIHTQSPRLTTIGDGGASGGLDSRFDFVLVSDPILTGAKGIQYLPGTYTAYGNDGKHYNKALTDLPTNSAVSEAVANDLYYCSDHLPVFADFRFTPTLIPAPAGIPAFSRTGPQITAANPFTTGITLHGLPTATQASFRYTLSAPDGRIVQSGALPQGQADIPVAGSLAPGIYTLLLTGSLGDRVAIRLIHQ